MKQYKLIKEYPGSPEVGTIYEEQLSHYEYVAIAKYYKHHISAEIIENNPEFFELVQPSYLERHNSCVLKVGDYVKVIRNAKSQEDGWQAFWLHVMNNKIGEVCQIIADIHVCEFELDDGFNYPYFVLEKVEPVFQITDLSGTVWNVFEGDEYWVYGKITESIYSNEANKYSSKEEETPSRKRFISKEEAEKWLKQQSESEPEQSPITIYVITI
jgi:hypothetical protein